MFFVCISRSRSGFVCEIHIPNIGSFPGILRSVKTHSHERAPAHITCADSQMHRKKHAEHIFSKSMQDNTKKTPTPSTAHTLSLIHFVARRTRAHQRQQKGKTKQRTLCISPPGLYGKRGNRITDTEHTNAQLHIFSSQRFTI